MANRYVAQLLAALERRYSRDFIDMPMIQWIEQNTTIRGRPFSTRGYAFQDQIANDLHHDLTVKKCSQVGLTELQIRKMLAFLVRNRGTSGMFTLAEEKLFKKISQTRVKPIVDKDAAFNMEGDEKAIRSMGIMQFGASFLYMTGCTEGDATSTSVDIMFNDEVDLSPQEMMALLGSRLQNSDYKIRQGFSTPTWPGYGVDLAYESTDQHDYVCKCTTCNHHNIPEFTRAFCDIPGLSDSIEDLTEIQEHTLPELDLLNSFVVCERCRTPLDLGNPELREWVPRYPTRSRDKRGYDVTPFATSRLPPSYIIRQLVDYSKRNAKRRFMNTVLAKAYADGNNRLEVSTIEACYGSQQVPEIGSLHPVALGIDVGQTCHLVLGSAERLEALMFETLPANQLVKRVEELKQRYNLVAGAMDRQPYQPTAEKVMQVTDGKVVPVQYVTSNRVDYSPQHDKLKFLTHYAANRTTLIDDIANSVREGEIRLSGYQDHKETITEHLRDMVREEEPEQPAEWTKLTGQDHWFHALGFYKAGLKIKNIEFELSDQDARSMVLVSVQDIKAKSQNLFGSSKRVDAFNRMG